MWRDMIATGARCRPRPGQIHRREVAPQPAPAHALSLQSRAASAARPQTFTALPIERLIDRGGIPK